MTSPAELPAQQETEPIDDVIRRIDVNTAYIASVLAQFMETANASPIGRMLMKRVNNG